MVRARVSLDDPGGYPTISEIGRDGYVDCARPGSEWTAASAKASAVAALTLRDQAEMKSLRMTGLPSISKNAIPRLDQTQ
jgi:hypothetical protein